MVLMNVYNCDIKPYHMRQIKYIKSEKKNHFKNITQDNIYNLTDDEIAKISSGTSLDQLTRKSNSSSKKDKSSDR
jgi:hypothetical protein